MSTTDPSRADLPAGAPTHPDPPPGWRVGTANFLSTVAVLTLGAFVGGSAARLHWMCELLTHFRVHAAAILLMTGLALLLCRAWCRGLAAISAGLAISATLLPLLVPLSEPPDDSLPTWRLVSVNVYADSRQYEQFVDFLKATQPDVVVCLEINQRWSAVLADLQTEYPHQERAPLENHFGLAVLSRFPIRDARLELLSEHNPALIVYLETAPGEVCTLFAIHPVPPMSAGGAARRNSQLARLARLVQGATAPVVVAGDFNATSWSPAFSDLVERTDLVDSRLGKGIQPTWQSPLNAIGIPIDHALVSPGMQVADRQVGPDIGSDHRPIIVDIVRQGERPVSR